jgi:ssDNA thymidine ADP-ribosyltransferase, DarT
VRGPEPPDNPKIYHILHVDRLASVVADGALWCDAVMVENPGSGTVIGMDQIKHRRLHECTLRSHPGLRVGQCVPFYFCPRSVMLYLIWKGNHPNLGFRGGQGPILHLEADLRATVDWANRARRRWAFTLSNAGAYYVEDRCDVEQLGEVNWEAVASEKWSGPGVPSSVRHGKQAEFLIEHEFPWELVERIGAVSPGVAQQAANALHRAGHRPTVEIRPDWYY